MEQSNPGGVPPFEPLELVGRRGVEHIPVLAELPSFAEYHASQELLPLEPEPVARSRRVGWPLILFVATCAATFVAGAIDWGRGGIFARPEVLTEMLRAGWRDGLWYMATVMAVLVAHEMGHFLQAVRYGIPASLPFFIPMPVTPIGTMGAVIGMHGSKADRRQMFDIGITGPLAGLAVAIPLMCYGIYTAQPYVAVGKEELEYGGPLLMQWIVTYVRPDLVNVSIADNPYWKAAWVGFLVTGLNMLPVSQLDGGHVAYALFLRRAHLLARGVMILAMLFILVYEQIGWVVMLLLVMMIGTDHPPTRDDKVPLGPVRYLLGLAALVIPLLCLTAVPIRMGQG